MATRLIGEFIMSEKLNSIERNIFELTVTLEDLRNTLEPEEFKLVEFKLEDVIMELSDILDDVRTMENL